MFLTEAGPGLPQQVARGDHGVLEHQLAAARAAHRHVRDVVDGELRLGRVDQERRDPEIDAPLVQVPRDQDPEVAAERVGDVDLAAVHDEPIPLATRRGAQGARVRAGLGLGEGEPAEPAAGEHRLQEPGPLGRIPGPAQEHGDHPLHVEGRAQRPPAAAGLLHQDREHHRAHLVAAVLATDHPADVAELVQPRKDVPGELAALLTGGHERGHLLVEVAAHRALEILLVRAQTD